MNDERGQSEKVKNYWFPAKRFGWGWGLPSMWQGWFVLLAFLVGISVLPFVVDPSAHLLLFIVAATGLTALLFVVCYAKGEPPRWRWGKSPRH